MKEEKEKNTAQTDIEQEIRRNRKFSFNRALAEKGSGLMKGGSPVARLKQVHLELEDFLEKALKDSEGALRMVLKRRLDMADAILGDYLDHPHEGLAVILKQILASQTALHDFVREVDAQWGRIYQERPFFNLPGRTPHREDPYTPSSVQVALEQVLSQLEK